MMVTVTQVNDDAEGSDTFLSLLTKLEAKGLLPEEKIATYKMLTEKLYKDNFQAFLTEFNQSGSRLVNTFCIDVMSLTPDISQAALQAVGFCVYHEEIVSILSESDIDILLKALQNVLLKTSDKGTCTRALWCIAKQRFSVRHVKPHLHGLLCSLDHVLLNGDFKSVTVEHETINAIIKLLETLPDEMLANTLRWAKLILPSLVHSAVKVRLRALLALELALPAMVKFRQELASTVVQELKTNIITEMSKLFACKHELYVLKIWGQFVILLGKTMHRGGSLINLMLGLAEQGFKHQLTDVKIAAFHAWKILIENFALDPDILYNQKRIKLLVQPFRVNNAKTEGVAMVKFEVWWFLIKALGPKAATNFDQVCAPLLQFSLGLASSNGVHIPPTSSGAGNGMKHLLSTPVHRKVGNTTPVTPTLNLNIGSPGPIHPVFKSIQLKGVEALAHILGKCDSSSPKPTFTLEPLEHDIITSPTLFNKLGHTLLHAATLVCCSLATDVADVQVFNMWYSIVAHLRNLIDNTPRNDTSDMLSHFFMCIQSIIKAETLPKYTVLRLLEAVSALPKKALSSSFFTTGTVQLLHGTPALFLIGLLFSDCLVHDLEERFFCIFEALVECGMTTPGGALGFSQSVFSLLDTATSKVSNKEHVCRLWSTVVNPLLVEIEKTNEVNQGDSLEHDFSTMYAALAFPVIHILPKTIPLANQKSLLKTWTELYQAFARCSALVATSEANHACEELAQKVIRLLDDKMLSNLSTLVALSEICLVLINNLDWSALTNENHGMLSPHKRAGLSRRPLGNLTSAVKFLCRVIEAFHGIDKKVSTMEAHFMPAIDNLLEVVSKLVSHLTMQKHLISLLDKVVKPVAAFYDVSLRKFVPNPSHVSTLDEKLKKLLADLLTIVQNRIKGPYDNKLLMILSPILEKTISHPKGSFKSQSVLFWNATFGKAKQLDYPDSIKPVLNKVKKETPLLLPSWSDTHFDVVEETPISQLTEMESNTQSFVEPAPIVRPFGSPSPHKMHGSFLRRPTETEKLVNLSSPRRKSPAHFGSPSPKTLSATKGTCRRLNIDEDSKSTFVKIAASPKKKLILTEHQKEVMRERGVVPTMYNDLDQSQDTQLFSNMFSQTQDNSMNTCINYIVEKESIKCDGPKNGSSSPTSKVCDADHLTTRYTDCPLLEEAVGPDFFWRNTGMNGVTKDEEHRKKKLSFADAIDASASLHNGESASNCTIADKTEVNTSAKKHNKNCAPSESNQDKTENTCTNIVRSTISEVVDSEINSELCAGVEDKKLKKESSSTNVEEFNIAPIVSIAETQDSLIITQDTAPITVQFSHLTPEKKSSSQDSIKESPVIKKLISTPVLKLMRLTEENVERLSPQNSKAFRSLDITSSPNVYGSQPEKELKKQSLQRSKSEDTIRHSPCKVQRSASIGDGEKDIRNRLNCTQDDLARLAEKFEFDDIRPLNDDSENEEGGELNASQISSQNTNTKETVKAKKSKRTSNKVKNDTPVKRSARNLKNKIKSLEPIDENEVKSLDSQEPQRQKTGDNILSAKCDENEPIKNKGKRGRKRKNENNDSHALIDAESEEHNGESKNDNSLIQTDKRESKRRKKFGGSEKSVAEETDSSTPTNHNIAEKSFVGELDVDNISFNSCEDMFEGMGGTQDIGINQKHVTEEVKTDAKPVAKKTKVIKTYGKQKFVEIDVAQKDFDINSDKQLGFESEDDLTLAEIKECYLDGNSQDSTDDEITFMTKVKKTKGGTGKERLSQNPDNHSKEPDGSESEDELPLSQLKENTKQTQDKKLSMLKSSFAKKKSPESVFSKKALQRAIKSPAKRTQLKSTPGKTSKPGRPIVFPRRLRSETVPVASRLRSKSGESIKSRRITPVKRRCSTPKFSSKTKPSFFEGMSSEPLNSQEYKMFNMEDSSFKNDEKTLGVISECREEIVPKDTANYVEKEKVSEVDIKLSDDTDTMALKENISGNFDSLKQKCEDIDLVGDKEINEERKTKTPENVFPPHISEKIDENNDITKNSKTEQIEEIIIKKQIDIEKEQTSKVIGQKQRKGVLENELIEAVVEKAKDDVKEFKTGTISVEKEFTSSNQTSAVDATASDDVRSQDDDMAANDDLKRIFEDADDPEDIIHSSQSPTKSEVSEKASRIDILKQRLSEMKESAKVATTMSSNLAKSISTAVENLATSPVIPMKFSQYNSPPGQSSRKSTDDGLPDHSIPGVFSPHVSPSAGILKHQPGSSNSPSPKTRRVSFAEPIEQLNAKCLSPTSDGGKNVNRCLEMNRPQLPMSPLVTTTPSKVVNVNSRYITTPSSSRRSTVKSVSCGGIRFRKTLSDRRRKLRDYSHASPRLVKKAFRLGSNGSDGSQHSQLTQGSPGSGFDSDQERDEFDSQQAVFPLLINCTAPVVRILPKLTSSMWSRGLGQLIRARNIITVGHLSALTPTDLRTLPIRSPKVKTVKKALETFHQQLIARGDNEVQQNVKNAIQKEGTSDKEKSTNTLGTSTDVETLLKNTGTVISEMDKLSQTLKENSPVKTKVTENHIQNDSLRNVAVVSGVVSDTNSDPVENNSDKDSSSRNSLKRKLEDTTPKKSKKCRLVDNLEELASEFVNEDLSELSSEQIFRAHQQVSSLMVSIVQALRTKCQSPK
ncbi:telomere-associated protein RIF1-like [Anneissia japonica]|uniref:telomere-associated protein RIF1-like n=1 Tax=Anneissia japonica TaxID=1529436 RepID=UPI001425A969|nr:telomere-associated protein RIF1-like [Anneissia japonica]